MLFLTMHNGMKLAIDGETIAAVEENPDHAVDDGEGGKVHSAIVYVAGHRFVTANAFSAVYEDWIADTTEPDETVQTDGTKTT